MASLGGNITPPDGISPKIFFAGIAGVVFFSIGLYQLSSKPSQNGRDEDPSLVKSLLLFCYSCFIKPHSAAAPGSQQSALESFYASQAGVVCVPVSGRLLSLRRCGWLTRPTVRCDEEDTPQRPRGHAGARRGAAPVQG